MARLVVQKYGGSSLADAERIRHVAGRIARDRREGNDLVVVVSAMGDTTDHLIALAAAITDQPDPREMDLLLATGEHMSGTLVAMALHALGVDAISLTGPQAGIRTDRTHGRARIANIEPARIRAELQPGRVVIVAGFQGSTDETFLSGEVTTLGRGGSDTTAVALAASLAADSCEIYTDVEGIYTADPRIVPDARLIDEIGYEEMLELAHQGAQVMQTRAVELGWVNHVVIRVRSTFSEHPGTTITEVTDMELRDKVRGMAFDRKVAKVTLVGVPDRPGIARSIFEPLADQGINVDVIVQNVGHEGTTDMSFTVNEVDLGRAERLLDLLVRRSRLRRHRDRREGREDLDRGRGHPERARLRGADVRGARGCRRQHPDDLDVGDPDHLHHRRGRSRRRCGRDPPHVPPRGSTASDRGGGGSRLGVGSDEPDSRGSNASIASDRRRTSCAAGSPTRSPRSASRSLTSRPPVAAASTGHGRRRLAGRSSRPPGSAQRTLRRSMDGAWERSSPWRCSTGSRRSSARPPANSP